MAKKEDHQEQAEPTPVVAKKYTATRTFHYYVNGSRTREIYAGEDASAIPQPQLAQYIADGWVKEG